MKRTQLLELLRTGKTDCDPNCPDHGTIAQRIFDMDENELKQAVVDFIYGD